MERCCLGRDLGLGLAQVVSPIRALVHRTGPVVIQTAWVEGLGCHELTQLFSGSLPSTPGVLLSSQVSTEAFLTSRHRSYSMELRFHGMSAGIWDQQGYVKLTHLLFHRVSQCLRFVSRVGRAGQGPSVTPMQHTSGPDVPRNLFQETVTTVP